MFYFRSVLAHLGPLPHIGRAETGDILSEYITIDPHSTHYKTLHAQTD